MRAAGRGVSLGTPIYPQFVPPSRTPVTRIGQWLRLQRTARGETQAAVAARYNGAATHISDLETGKKVPEDVLEQLIHVWDLEPNEAVIPMALRALDIAQPLRRTPNAIVDLDDVGAIVRVLRLGGDPEKNPALRIILMALATHAQQRLMSGRQSPTPATVSEMGGVASDHANRANPANRDSSSTRVAV